MANGKQNAGLILPEFTVDDLGTSFKVVLINSVTSFERDNKKEIFIPDYQNLLKKIAVSRAAHPAKLKGGDIKFLRKNLGLRSKDLAEKLDISPEHLSRCEAGDKILSPNSEKVLRSLVIFEAVYVLQKALEDFEGNKAKIQAEVSKLLERLKVVMEGLKIQPVHSADKEVIFYFKRVPHSASQVANDDLHSDPPEWLDEAA